MPARLPGRVTGLGDVHVVAQTVEVLRPVGLRVDRLQLVALDVHVGLGATLVERDGVRVGAGRALPDPGQRGERAEVGERVGVEVGLGEDVAGHAGTLTRSATRGTTRGRWCAASPAHLRTTCQG